MIDRITLNRWSYRGLFLALASVIMFTRLLPLDLGAGRLPGPDLMLLLVCAIIVRRPDYIPVSMVAALFFLADMLFQQPPGVWTLMVVAGTEFLRTREGALREQNFVMEFGMVAGTLVLMVLGQRLLMAVFLVEQVALGRAILFLIATVLTYPLVAAVTVFVLRVRKLQPGEDEISGHYT